MEEQYYNMIEIIEEDPNKTPYETLCCLIEDGVKCERLAGNASYNKRVQKVVVERGLNLVVDKECHHVYICEYHKDMIQSVRSKRKHHDLEEEEHPDCIEVMEEIVNEPYVSEVPQPKSSVIFTKKFANPSDSVSVEPMPTEVDFTKLQMSTLRRYKQMFKLSAPPNLNKAQLAETISKHFKTIEVDEKEIISRFIYCIKTKGNKLDHPTPPSTSESSSSGAAATGVSPFSTTASASGPFSSSAK